MPTKFELAMAEFPDRKPTKEELLKREPNGTFWDEFYLTHGREMSSSEAYKLEKRLARDENDLRARLQLLGYYYPCITSKREPDSSRRHKHILWMIDHRPSDVACSSPHFIWVDATRGYRYQGWRHWQKQIQKYPNDPWVIANAASYCTFVDEEYSYVLLKRAVELAPDDEELAYTLTLKEKDR